MSLLLGPSTTRSEIAELVPAHVHRILDVGCGTGGFARELARRGIGSTIWGIDPSPDCNTDGVDSAYERVVAGTYPEVIDEELVRAPAFDCVVFNDVLEHMVRPDCALVRTREILAPGGVIICSIPNVRYVRNLAHLVVQGEWQYEKQGILDFTHLRFFTFRSAKRLVRGAGYTIERAVGVNGVVGRKVPPAIRGPLLRVRDRIPDPLFPQIAIVARPSAEGSTGPLWAPM